MRRFAIAALLAMLMLVLSVSAAFAQSPHFIGTPSCTNVVLHIQQPPGTDLLTFSFGTIDP